MHNECIIIGGGIAGLQAAIQLGRYQHKVMVIDSGYGRSTLCRSYHNLLGWPDGVSGDELRKLGRQQAEKLGVQFLNDEVVELIRNQDDFTVKLRNDPDSAYTSRTLLLATGVLDRFPPLANLEPCLGLTIYVCPDCDGYEIKDKRTIVMGSGEAGVHMALALTYWTNHLMYINHEQREISQQSKDILKQQNIDYLAEPIEKVLVEQEGVFRGVQLKNGQEITAERGFISFGGNEVKTNLAHRLGVERMENSHILTDPRTKETNVPNVWAAGDIGVHSEQVTIAMGEGSQAAIWIHKKLLH